MIDYLLVFIIGFLTPYMLKFIVFPLLFRSDWWREIEEHIDTMKKKREKK